MLTSRPLSGGVGPTSGGVLEKRMKSAMAKLSVVVLLMLTVPLAAGAQPAVKVYRLGILGDKASDANETLVWLGRFLRVANLHHEDHG